MATCALAYPRIYYSSESYNPSTTEYAPSNTTIWSHITTTSTEGAEVWSLLLPYNEFNWSSNEFNVSTFDKRPVDGGVWTAEATIRFVWTQDADTPNATATSVRAV